MKIKRGSRRIAVVFAFSLLLYWIVFEFIGNAASIVLFFPLLLCVRLPFNIGKSERNLLGYLLYAIMITTVHWKQLYNTQNALNMLIEYTIILLTMPIYKIADSYKLIKLIRNIGLFLCIFGVFESIFQYPILLSFLRDVTYINSIGSSSYRIVLIFFNALISGTMLLLFWGALYCIPIKKVWLNVCANLLVIYNILGNKSRSLWLAFIIVFFIIFYKNRKNIRMNQKHLKYIVIIAFLLIFAKIAGIDILNRTIVLVFERLSSSFDSGGEGHIIRIETILNSCEYWSRKENFARFVLGSGKNYSIQFMIDHPILKGDSFKWDGCIDNQYFTIIHDFGIVGLFFILKILIVSLKRLRRCNCENRLLMFPNLMLIGLSVCLFFYEGFNYIFVFWLFAFLVALSDKESGRKVRFYI